MSTLSGAEREESAPSVAPDAGSDLLRVRVVLASDGRPLPGVEVLYFDSGVGDPLAYEEFVREVDASLEAVVASFGRTYRSDALGIAAVPFPRGAGSVGVLHGGNWAQESIAPIGPDEVVLALEPEQGFDVRVLDEAGAPVAGTPLELLEFWQEGGALVHGVERTDEFGRAHFGHLGALQRSWIRRPLALTELFLRARVLAPTPTSWRLESESWPSGEIVLALSTSGTVTLELVDAEGAPYLEDARIELALPSAQRERFVAPDNALPVGVIEARAQRGTAHFERVGLGLELVATTRADGRRTVTHGFRGPTHGGEEVRLRVELAAPLPLVRGRLVDTGGRPLAARSVRAELWSLRHHSRDVQRRRTDEEGHFSGFGGAGLVGLGGHSILFALDDDERAVALRELPFPVPEGVIDLGDVMLELTDVATDQRVVLGHGPRARLVLANGLPQLPPAWSLRARVLGTDERESTATFDARGEAMLTLGETGSMPVTLWLERRADEGLHAVNGLPWSIDVADSTAEQSFTSPPFTREFLDHLERQTR